MGRKHQKDSTEDRYRTRKDGYMGNGGNLKCAIDLV